MSYTYKLEGSNGGYPLFDIPEPEPAVICELCNEICTDDFHVVDITASLSIIVCPDCHNQDQIEYESVIETIKNKS